MRVLVCGSRDWDDGKIIRTALAGLLSTWTTWSIVNLTVIEGGAPGADRLAGEWAEQNPVKHETYPADWNRYNKAAGHIRNQQMIDEGHPELVLAFKDGFNWTLSKGGTEDMVKRAKKAGIPYYVTSRA